MNENIFIYQNNKDRLRKKNKSSAVAEMGDHARAKRAEKWWGTGGKAPFRGRAWYPSDTVRPVPGLLAYQVVSKFIQPFGHNTPTSHRPTDRTGQDRTDRQRSNRIGRTVLQTFAQKY